MQNRPPPAYQEYAASMLSKQSFRNLSMEERGLLYTIRMECWINHSLPANLVELSRVLGVQKIKSIANLKPFLCVINKQITCPDLDDYRGHLEAISLAKSRAGIASGKARTKAYSESNTCSTRDEQMLNTLSIVHHSIDSITKKAELDEITQLFEGGNT